MEKTVAHLAAGVGDGAADAVDPARADHRGDHRFAVVQEGAAPGGDLRAGQQARGEALAVFFEA